VLLFVNEYLIFNAISKASILLSVSCTGWTLFHSVPESFVTVFVLSFRSFNTLVISYAPFAVAVECRNIIVHEVTRQLGNDSVMSICWSDVKQPKAKPSFAVRLMTDLVLTLSYASAIPKRAASTFLYFENSIVGWKHKLIQLSSHPLDAWKLRTSNTLTNKTAVSWIVGPEMRSFNTLIMWKQLRGT
jgi:hypothetical protein